MCHTHADRLTCGATNVTQLACCQCYSGDARLRSRTHSKGRWQNRIRAGENCLLQCLRGQARQLPDGLQRMQRLTGRHRLQKAS
jgi:cytochrome c5